MLVNFSSLSLKTPVAIEFFNAKLFVFVFVFVVGETFDLLLSPQLVKVASNTADNAHTSKKD
jgi:hypothetical protein